MRRAGAQLNAGRVADVETTLLCIGRQLGLSSMDEQSKVLCVYASAKEGLMEVPFPFPLRKLQQRSLTRMDAH